MNALDLQAEFVLDAPDPYTTRTAILDANLLCLMAMQNSTGAVNIAAAISMLAVGGAYAVHCARWIGHHIGDMLRAE